MSIQKNELFEKQRVAKEEQERAKKAYEELVLACAEPA